MCTSSHSSRTICLSRSSDTTSRDQSENYQEPIDVTENDTTRPLTLPEPTPNPSTPMPQPENIPHLVPIHPPPPPKPPIVTEECDGVKTAPSVFELLRMSAFDKLFSMGPAHADLVQTVRVFKATFSSVALALSGFYIDSSLKIRCSGCRQFNMSPVDAFKPCDVYSQRCRREWCNLLNALCHERCHGSKCFWTQQLRIALETGNAAESANTNDATSSQMDYRSTLVLPLQKPPAESIHEPVYSINSCPLIKSVTGCNSIKRAPNRP